MKVEIKENVIEVKDTKNFDIAQILECGQVFRYKLDTSRTAETGETYAEIFSLDKYAEVFQKKDNVKIFSNDAKYFAKYLDFDTKYGIIVSKLTDKPLVASAAVYGSGIRILRQDPFETIISFIISANNHIPRIKSIIERLCDSLGRDMGTYRAFPTAEALACVGEDFFKSAGAGYRAAYIAKTAKILEETDIVSEIEGLKTSEAIKRLTMLPGVGPKVADCILLFGFHRTDVFPIDTWIKKVYHDMVGDGAVTVAEIRRQLTAEFGDLSGYAQQYLFFHKRELEKRITRGGKN